MEKKAETKAAEKSSAPLPKSPKISLSSDNKSDPQPGVKKADEKP